MRPLSRALLCVLSLVTVGATMVVASPTVGADSVASARAKAAAIAASLAAAQNKMSALGQQYDAARAQLGQVQNDIVATKAAVEQKQRQVAHDKQLLVKAAVSAYVSDGSAVADNPLFSSNETAQGAANEYRQITSGDINEAVANLNTAKNTLSAQEAQLTAQERQAQGAVSSEQAAISANQAGRTTTERRAGARERRDRHPGGAATTGTSRRGSASSPGPDRERRRRPGPAHSRRESRRLDPAGQLAECRRHRVAEELEAEEAEAEAVAAEAVASSAPTPYVPLPVAPGGVGAVSAAETQLGVPYVWGGESPGAGFDCSGLVQWAWRQAGVSLPRTSGAQFAASTPVSIADLEPGDLLFYGPSGSDHVAMYVGGGMMIEAPETGEVVHITPLRLGGYGESFAGAGRP